MKPESHPIEKFLNEDSGRRRNYLTVFLICLGISILLWLLIAFSGDSITTIDIAVEIENVPENLDISNLPDSIIHVSVSGSPSFLFQLDHLSGPTRITIDLKKYYLQQSGELFFVNIPTESLYKEFSQDFSEKLDFKNIYPDFIKVELEKIDVKTVPVRADLELKFKPQYNLIQDIIIEPDSILVRGNKTSLNKISSVSTTFETRYGINEKTEFELALINPMPDAVKLSEEKVKISLFVDRFTESSIELPIQNKTGIDGLKTLPNKVLLTYMVPLKDFNRINADMFIISPKTPDTSGISIKTPLKILRKPDFIIIKNIKPDSVNYILLI